MVCTHSFQTSCSFRGLYAQSSELGFGIGTLTYTGDLVRNYDFKYSRPAGTVFYRANISTGGQLPRGSYSWHDRGIRKTY